MAYQRVDAPLLGIFKGEIRPLFRRYALIQFQEEILQPACARCSSWMVVAIPSGLRICESESSPFFSFFNGKRAETTLLSGMLMTLQRCNKMMTIIKARSSRRQLVTYRSQEGHFFSSAQLARCNLGGSG